MHIRKLTSVFILAACLALTVAPAAAQQLNQGTSYVDLRGGVYGGLGKNTNLMATYGGAFGYFVAKNFALEAEGLGYYFGQKESMSTNGAGVNVLGKWHFVATPKTSMYVGAGAGGVWSGEKVSVEGQTGNWSGLGELGMTFAVTKSFNLKAGGRYQQIGPFDKTGASMLGGNLGLMVTF